MVLLIGDPFSDTLYSMGRHRLPSAKSSSYITPQGAAKLREELDYLWRVKRPQVTQAVSEAAAQGDRSENAEYIYGKKQLQEIDRRIRYLQKRLDSLVIVEHAPSDTSCIFFGAWIRLETETGEKTRYRIVGPDETDLTRGFISIDSPLARALLKKSANDEVTVTLPDGQSRYTVLEIRYMPFEDVD
jgi:transcription elongation factor GreB